MAPPCDPWSQRQHMNRAMFGQEYQRRLLARRQEHEECFLQLVRELYDGQVRDGGHAHIEAPWAADGIHTVAWSDMVGYDARLDQCRFQANVTAVSHGKKITGLVMKPTRIRTTNRRLAVQIARRCQCRSPHIRLEGSNSKPSQNYPWPMAQELARLIMEPDFPDAAEMFPVEEDADGMREQHQEILKDLRKRFGSHVVAQVTKLHQQYNHQSCERLAK